MVTSNFTPMLSSKSVFQGDIIQGAHGYIFMFFFPNPLASPTSHAAEPATAEQLPAGTSSRNGTALWPCHLQVEYYCASGFTNNPDLWYSESCLFPEANTSVFGKTTVPRVPHIWIHSGPRGIALKFWMAWPTASHFFLRPHIRQAAETAVEVGEAVIATITRSSLVFSECSEDACSVVGCISLHPRPQSFVLKTAM